MHWRERAKELRKHNGKLHPKYNYIHTKTITKLHFASATKISENTANVFKLLFFKINSHFGPSG